MSDEHMYSYEYSQEEPIEHNLTTPRLKTPKPKQQNIILGKPSKINFDKIKNNNIQDTTASQASNVIFFKTLPKGITIKRPSAIPTSSTNFLQKTATLPLNTIQNQIASPTVVKPHKIQHLNPFAIASTSVVKSNTPKHIKETLNQPGPSANTTPPIKRKKISNSPDADNYTKITSTPIVKHIITQPKLSGHKTLPETSNKHPTQPLIPEYSPQNSTTKNSSNSTKSTSEVTFNSFIALDDEDTESRANTGQSSSLEDKLDRLSSLVINRFTEIENTLKMISQVVVHNKRIVEQTQKLIDKIPLGELDGDSFNIKFPIENDEALQQLEDISNTKEGKRMLRQKFKDEGDSVPNLAKRTIKNLFRNTSRYTWTGKTGSNASKDPYIASKLNTIVILEEVMVKRFRVTQAEAERAVKKQLQNFNEAKAKRTKRHAERDQKLGRELGEEEKDEDELSQSSSDEA